jgi:hypothetical protein
MKSEMTEWDFLHNLWTMEESRVRGVMGTGLARHVSKVNEAMREEKGYSFFDDQRHKAVNLIRLRSVCRVWNE